MGLLVSDQICYVAPHLVMGASVGDCGGGDLHPIASREFISGESM